jgi:hypothetical protein
VELVRPGDTPPTGGVVRLKDRSELAHFLRAFSRDPMNLVALRRALGEEIGCQRVSRLGDAEVVEQLAAHLARDRFRIVPLASSRTVVKPRRIDDWTTRTEKVEKEEEVVKERPTGPPPTEPEPLTFAVSAAFEETPSLTIPPYEDETVSLALAAEPEEPVSLALAADAEESLALEVASP